MWQVLPLLLIACLPLVIAVEKNLQDLPYRVYPRRTQEEAAVLEWGHSAVISALDCSVAHFGPQTSDAALLEVESTPVLAVPVTGVSNKLADKIRNGEEYTLEPLENTDEVTGNLVVMTNAANISGVQMAKIAQLSGAVALLVVNVDEERPDDTYRIEATEGAEEIDIPVVMISLNSANVLTTATVTPNMRKSDIINNGMPDRVRLYAGGDRPFFEDVEASEPTIYLIHNLLTGEECDQLIRQTSSKMSTIEKADDLQLTPDPTKFHKVERVMLWQGLLQTPTKKAIDERIEQVTGFPSSHLSDFIVDKFEKGSHWKPGYDAFRGPSPMASIMVFLSEDPHGGDIVYPSTKGDPVKIRPTKGLAVVHHNSDDRHQFDMNALRAILPVSEGPFYVASRYIFPQPLSYARRIVLPLFAAPFGGKLPGIFVTVYNMMVERFGLENGNNYFDKLCILVPALIVALIVQYVSDKIQHKGKTTTTSSKKKKKKD